MKTFYLVGISYLCCLNGSIAQKGMVLSSHPRSYYLNNRGNDKNSGDRAHPWKTITRLNRTGLHAGDNVCFQGGQVFKGRFLVSPGNGGDPSRPVRIGTYGKGVATIHGGDSSAIVLYQAGYVVIRNLRLTGTGRKNGNVKEGLSLLESHQITLDSLDISGFQKAGLFIYSSSAIRASRINAHDNGSAGISVEGIDGKLKSRDIQISDCLAENNPGDPTNLTNHSGNGIIVGHCTNVVIDRCVATNNGWDMPRIGNGPVGIWCYEADSVVIQHCISYRNKTSVGGADGGGYDLDGGVTNSIIQYCLSYENQGSGYGIFQYWGASPWFNNVLRYNISENDGFVSDGRGGIYIWNSSDDKNQFYDCLVHNNTVYNSKEAAISFSEKSERKQFYFFNNILVGKDSLIKGNKGADIFQGNLWWSLTHKDDVEQHYGKLPGWIGEPHLRNPGNTKLLSPGGLMAYDKYTIPVGSPLRTAGQSLPHLSGIAPGNMDFNGQPAPGKGIGASFLK
ncbi:right-handed parallel beta-helix repeat-containing protein [Flavitalea flava]